MIITDDMVINAVENWIWDHHDEPVSLTDHADSLMAMVKDLIAEAGED